MKMAAYLVLGVVMLVGAAPAAQAVTVTNNFNNTVFFDDFEAGTDGLAPVALTGTWSKSGTVEVGSGVSPAAFEGSKYLRIARPASAFANLGAQSGSIHSEFMMYVDSTNMVNHGVELRAKSSGGTNLMTISLQADGSIKYYDGSAYQNTIGTYATDVWQKWAIDLDTTTDQFQYSVDGVAGLPGYAPLDTTTADVGSLIFGSGAGAGNQYFIDAVPVPLGPFSPQPQATLEKMIQIDYSLGERLPEGLQDSGIGIVNNTLISVGGFNDGSGPGGREFHNDTNGLDLSNPNATWQTLPAYPGQNVPTNVDGSGVSGLISSSTVMNNELYIWGGFNYTAPYTYAEGYKLSHTGGAWQWTQMPSLPEPVLSTGLVSVGNKLYAVGGADYDRTKFYTQTDSTGVILDFGAKTYVLDTDNPGAGWQEVAEMPGTPRWDHSTSVIGDKIYVIGGTTGNNDDGFGNISHHTVVDNWVYDTTTDTWSRIRDLPVASGNFPGNVVIDDRFILLIAGFQYHLIENPDGSTRPVYGTATSYPDTGFYADVWVYDTQTNLFGTADLLPLNIGLPASVYKDGVLHMIGGEAFGTTVFGQAVANHPDLYLRGDITVLILDGDLNGDGFVGIADLNIVLGNWNLNVAAGDPLAGDPSSDGFVGIEDLNTVLGNWNAGIPPATAIPEPGSLGILTIGAMRLMHRTRRPESVARNRV